MENRNADVIQIDLYPPITLSKCDLMHVGYSRNNKQDTIPQHLHDIGAYELTAILSGRGRCFAGDLATPVKKGDIYVSFPYESHQVEADPENDISQLFITFRVSDPVYEEAFKKIWKVNIPPTNRVFQNDQIKVIIDTVISELQSTEKLYRTEFLSTLTEQILIYFLRAYSNRTSIALSRYPSPEELSHHIMHYIDTHVLEMRSLTEISDALSYHYNYLSLLFKKTQGYTIADYYLSKRMEFAKFMLSQQRYSITEIAERLNYSDVFSFSKAFRAFYGISPKKYISGNLSESNGHNPGKESGKLL